MRITYIKLVGFKRFPLRQSEVFEHTFNSKLTMITGPNGAGKSSLFNELTPLPSDKSDFHKGGFKEIHIDNEGKTYQLTSCFKEGAKYSFLCDGLELNSSGNVTAQKDLTKIHFNITPTIHELLTGGESFTEMTLPSRKKLFNSITHMNIDSILESYDSLRQELKNNEFLVKSLTSRLVSEQHKLMDDNRKDQLNDKLIALRSHIEYLLSILTKIHHYKEAPELENAVYQYQSVLRQLNYHYRNNLTRLSAYPLDKCSLVEAQCKVSLQAASSKLQELYTFLEKLLHQKTAIEFAQNADKQSIDKEIASLHQSAKNLLQGLCIVDPHTEHLNTVSAELNMLERCLPDILQTLPTNIDRKLSKTAHSSLLEQKNILLTQLHETLSERIRITNELQELQRHQQLQCPSCDHRWLPQEVNGLIHKAQLRLKEISELRVTLDTQMTSITKELEVQSNYLTEFHNLNGLYSATKHSLSSLWTIVSNRSLAYENPQAILTLVSQGINEVNDVLKYQQTQVRLKELNESLQHLELAGNSSFMQNEKDIRQTEEAIANTMDTVQSLKDKISDIEQTKLLHTQLNTLKKTRLQLQSNLRDANLRYVMDTVSKEIDTELSLTKVTLIEVQNELGQHDAIAQTVKTLQTQLDDANESIKVLTILTEELSPKNGFIAKTISHFLNVIIDSVNSVIAGVWDYKMVLKAIDVQTDSLNYRFKVEIEDRLTVDDVSKASAGMKEMINLAMKITLFKLLRLDNHPLHLDEMAAHLDATHTEKIVNLIYKLTTSSHYSQVFLITHKDDLSFLKNTEVIEL